MCQDYSKSKMGRFLDTVYSYGSNATFSNQAVQLLMLEKQPVNERAGGTCP